MGFLLQIKVSIEFTLRKDQSLQPTQSYFQWLQRGNWVPWERIWSFKPTLTTLSCIRMFILYLLYMEKELWDGIDLDNE